MTKTLRKDIPLLDVAEGDRIAIKSVAVFGPEGEQLGLDYAYDEVNSVVRGHFVGIVREIVRINPGSSEAFRIVLQTEKYGNLFLMVSRYNRDISLVQS